MISYEQVLTQAMSLPVNSRLKLISALSTQLAEVSISIPGPKEEDDKVWLSEFFAELDELPDTNLPIDLSTNKKYMEGYGQW